MLCAYLLRRFVGSTPAVVLLFLSAPCKFFYKPLLPKFPLTFSTYLDLYTRLKKLLSTDGIIFYLLQYICDWGLTR